MTYIALTKDNIGAEHICCAFSDKKCAAGYQLKKDWLEKEFDNGYRFIRLNERAKVFIEFGPAALGWAPIVAPNYLLINCFWVSGKYKGNGHGKALLEQAITEAKKQGMDGLVTIVGKKKSHFMSDGKWLLRQGFEVCATTLSGFNLIAFKLNKQAPEPTFNDGVLSGQCLEQDGLVAYYSDRCPYAEHHVTKSLIETAKNRNIPAKAIKIKSAEQAQLSPCPSTIFSLYYNGQFVTTDISVCMDSRFDKTFAKII